MGGSRKFCQRGSKFDFFFFFFLLVGEWIEDPNTAIDRPTSAHQRNAISMAFRWRADDDPILFYLIPMNRYCTKNLANSLCA